VSKLITQRLEYVIYDDATGNLTALPPTYPTVLDTYQTEVVSATGQSFGAATLSRSDAAAALILVPQGATLTCVAALANVQNVAIKSAVNVPLVPGGVATQLVWTVMPGQSVTVPGVYNSTATPLNVYAVDTTNTAANATAAVWSLQVMWSL